MQVQSALGSTNDRAALTLWHPTVPSQATDTSLAHASLPLLPLLTISGCFCPGLTGLSHPAKLPSSQCLPHPSHGAPCDKTLPCCPAPSEVPCQLTHNVSAVKRNEDQVPYDETTGRLKSPWKRRFRSLRRGFEGLVPGKASSNFGMHWAHSFLWKEEVLSWQCRRGVGWTPMQQAKLIKEDWGHQDVKV